MCSDSRPIGSGTFNVVPNFDANFERRKLVHWRKLTAMGISVRDALKSISSLTAEDLAEMYPTI